jgi:hypothetical protein
VDIATHRLAIRALRRAGLWSWQPDMPVTDRWGPIMVADVTFPAARLAVDLGGSTFPDGRSRAQLRLAAAGWTLASFARADLERRPSGVAREIRALLDRITPTRYP